MTALSPTGCEIAAALADIGVDGVALKTLEREERVAVLLPGDRIAWFPRSEAGRLALVCERRVLRLIERYCTFAAPRILHEATEGWDLRSMVPSADRNVFDLHARARSDRALAVRIGEQLGRILADQHSNIPTGELGDWLQSLPDWPRAEDLPHLPEVVRDRALLARIDRALAMRNSIFQEPGQRVLTHSDLGFHNIAFAPGSFDVVGVFDYDGAAFSDRHIDFNKMSLHCPDGSEPLLEAATDSYEQLTGIRIDRDRVRLLNATEAIGFLGYRFGHAPHEEWCGRTLAQDLEWAHDALGAAGI